jgi:ADP-ribose pyrophosphatase YjhB (NUDIX family)
MTRIEHYHDPEAPKANNLIPAASGVVTNERGEILLHRRSDNEYWSIPGGAMEPGETIRQTAIREIKEETGIDVEAGRLVGIYSDPNHVVEYSDGEVRQQFSVCFSCTPVGGELATSDESLDVGFFSPETIAEMPVHPSIRRRINDYLADRARPVID